MNISEYFRLSLRKKAYLDKAWVFSFFGVVYSEPDVVDNADGELQYTRTPELFTVSYGEPLASSATGEQEFKTDEVTGWKKNKPLALVGDTIMLKAGDLPNVTKDTITTYGRALWNAMVIAEPFGDKLEFYNCNVDIRDLEETIIKKQATGDIDIKQIDIYLAISVNQLTSFSQICVPSASEKTISTNKNVVKRRDELLLKYKDELSNPSTMAMIEKELVDMEKVEFKDDMAAGFYLKGKSYNVVRKRTHIMHGAEASFDSDGTINTIPKSLQEGWAIENIPELINSGRAGSYDRGKETAKGGAEVKSLSRGFQNTKISEDDCGSKIGYPIYLSKEEAPEYIGRYVFNAGKTVELTSLNIAQYTGKTVLIRSPMTCKTKNGNYCKTCVGTILGMHETAISMLVVSIGSAIMLSAMKAMHGKAIELVELDLFETIT